MRVLRGSKDSAHFYLCFGREIMAHEIGHHVYVPGNLLDQGRMIARIRYGLPGKEHLAPLVANRCIAVYLIGEAAAEIGAELAGTPVPARDVGDLEHAVNAVRAAARPGETVLLSPACASYDQYRDFEQRGEHFRALVTGR